MFVCVLYVYSCILVYIIYISKYADTDTHTHERVQFRITFIQVLNEKKADISFDALEMESVSSTLLL